MSGSLPQEALPTSSATITITVVVAFRCGVENNVELGTVARPLISVQRPHASRMGAATKRA